MKPVKENRSLSRRSVLVTSGISAAVATALLKTRGDRYHEGGGAADRSGMQVRSRPLSTACDQRVEVPNFRQKTQQLVDLSRPEFQVIKTPSLMHALRLCHEGFPKSRENLFDRSSYESFTGEEITKLLLDHRHYRTKFPGADPLLYKTRYGIAVRNEASAREGQFIGTLAHSDDLLACCAEIDLPSNHPVIASVSKGAGADAVYVGTLADLINDSIARFTIDQELPWTAESFSRYLDNGSWTNRFGEVSDFKEVAERLMALPDGQGACLGVHNIHALAVLYRVLSPSRLPSGTRARIASYLSDRSKRLESLVHQGRMWDGGWFKSASVGVDATLNTAISATGHHFEWLATLPPELRPPDAELRRVLQRVMGLIQVPEVDQRRHSLYLNLTHLCRGVYELFGPDGE